MTIDVEELKLIKLRPGDILVITTPEGHENSWLEKELEKYLGFPILILSKSPDISLEIIRPESPGIILP